MITVASSKGYPPRPAAALRRESWHELADRTRRFEPTVVVLIARKMPRLAELFRLSFGDRALVLSDLAIPFAHRFIAQQRVAIVDDVVNVGSTLQRAHDCVKACGAATIRLFALGTKNREKSDNTLIENTPIEYSHFEPLSEKAYDDLVTEVPAAIRQLAKPYDLEFPIIHCRLAAPARSAYTLLDLKQANSPATTVASV
jgi:hypothetical protein